MEKLGLNLGYLLVQILNFAILFIVLRKWVYEPVLGLLDKRRQTIAQGLEDARIAAEARANAERDAEKIVAEAQARAAQVVREATDRADAAARDVKAAADAEVAKAREAALAEVAQERNRILGELRSQVAALAVAAAQKIVGETLDEKRQHALVDQFFSGIKAGKVTLLEENTVTGASAEITSALPLTAEEQKIIRGELAPALSSGAEIKFAVDPGILGGLIVRVGDKVVDGSVTGQLQGLRQNLK
ncbi:MAG TPA: F0F1 ATP synthase subunit B [Anaerolineaceae bacterium]|nr:F0F1 ATP synthase subunit B [Anaerolineaceae bacterium]HPN51550.1 F0F1 ATP synthase subunit B [Anaerolineaceae bacterium]